MIKGLGSYPAVIAQLLSCQDNNKNVHTSQYHGLSFSRLVNVTPIAPPGYLTRLQYSDVLHIAIIELIIHQYRGMQPAFDGGCKLGSPGKIDDTKDLK